MKLHRYWSWTGAWQLQRVTHLLGRLERALDGGSVDFRIRGWSQNGCFLSPNYTLTRTVALAKGYVYNVVDGEHGV